MTEVDYLREALEIIADPKSWRPGRFAIPVKVSAIARAVLNQRYVLLRNEGG